MSSAKRKTKPDNNDPKIIVYLFILSIFAFAFLGLKAQQTRNVLFLGNSYTGVNNLPQLVHDVALSAGDTLIFDSYTPGGYRLSDHYSDSISLNKIISGGRDYIVLQGQSQEPILDQGGFNGGGTALNNFINQYDQCATTMFYMTWGRKNGNATYCPSYPVMCTYEGMDTSIRNNYISLTAALKTELSPVSIVWNYLRQNHPGIELYQSDESHPSAYGSYAAACSFYSTIFKKDPTLISYDFGLDAADAAIIRAVAKTQVFDHLNSWDYKVLPESDFRYRTGNGLNEVFFTPVKPGTAEMYFWDFGDGNTSNISNPVHSYSSDGTYTVSFTSSTCDLNGLHSSTTDTIIQFCSHTPLVSSPHSSLCQADTLWTQAADSYQWLYQGELIPETNQFLANYIQYGISNFSVLSTIAGCTELSVLFTDVSQWSGYYFDLSPGADPCTGDTVVFSVLHINGFLSGSEVIQWFKNDSLLSFANNDDTLLILNGGIYECKVIAPNSNCPLDTTSYSIEYSCSTIGIDELEKSISWKLFPNPVNEIVNVLLPSGVLQDELMIYDLSGRLQKQIALSPEPSFSVDDLAEGVYFIRLKNRAAPALKFIKY